MPVHVKREPDTSLVVFERDEEPATRHASGASRRACSPYVC
jgi:hypothetical protein